MSRLAAALLLTAAAPMAAAQPSATLYLRPNSGTATQMFVATFAFTPAAHVVCSGYTAHFTWDQGPLQDAQMTGSTTCTATVTAQPPAGDSAPGKHEVAAYTTPGAITAGPNEFKILAAAPSPSPGPSPSPHPSPSPSPSPTPSPQPSPSPSPSPPNLPCTVANVPSAPAAGATSEGTLQLQGLGGGPITIVTAGPPQMLPPQLGGGRLIAIELTKAEDEESPLLQNALTQSTVFPCAFVSLGQSAAFAYARYALKKVTVIGLQSSLTGSFQVEETVTLAYEQIEWSWQGEDVHGRLVSRSGGGAFGSTGTRVAAAAPGGGAPWAWVVLVLAALLAVAAGVARARRLGPFR